MSAPSPSSSPAVSTEPSDSTVGQLSVQKPPLPLPHTHTLAGRLTTSELTLNSPSPLSCPVFRLSPLLLFSLSPPFSPSSSVSKGEEWLTFDLGHLCAFDSAALPEELLVGGVTAVGETSALDSYTRDNAQLLINRLFALPTTPLPHDPGLLASLPPPVMPLPRAKPLPPPKVETKWEAFARTKGIEKKKRGRMVWDEEKGEYAARFGYQRANNSEEAVIIEEKETPQGQGKRAKKSFTSLIPTAPVVDPWTRLEEERKERKAHNLKQQERNLKAAEGQRTLGTVDLAAVQGQAGLGRKGKGKGGVSGSSPLPAPLSNHVDVALHVASQSTASMGRFDELRYREPPRLKKRKGEGVPDVLDGVDRRKERESQMAVLSQVVGNDPLPSVDVNKTIKVSKDDGDGGGGGGGAKKRRGGGGSRGGGRGGKGGTGGARGGRGRGAARGGRGGPRR